MCVLLLCCVLITYQDSVDIHITMIWLWGSRAVAPGVRQIWQCRLQCYSGDNVLPPPCSDCCVFWLNMRAIWLWLTVFSSPQWRWCWWQYCIQHGEQWCVQPNKHSKRRYNFSCSWVETPHIWFGLGRASHWARQSWDMHSCMQLHICVVLRDTLYLLFECLLQYPNEGKKGNK